MVLTETILIVDSRASAEKVSVYDRTRAGKRYSPARRSKFRILFALDAGEVKDEFQVFPWDGGKRLCAAQSRSELAPGYATFCTWVYEKFAKAIGGRKHGPTYESAMEIWT